MKRQDMINLISDNVITSLFPNLSLARKNLLADMMLTEVEKHGMMPPGREEDKITASTLNGEVISVSFEQYRWD